MTGAHPIRMMIAGCRAATMTQDTTGGPAMTQTAYQTVRLSKGRHDSPDRGACVMELASMLAGERFTDHPRAVCPVIAGFLRSYNDLLPDGQHDELYAYASLVVGTDAPRAVRRRRARRILEWGDGRTRRRWAIVRLQAWDFVLLPAVEAALRMSPEHRRAAVRALVEELCAIGRPSDVTGSAALAAPPDGPVPASASASVPADALAGSSGMLGAPAARFIRWR